MKQHRERLLVAATATPFCPTATRLRLGRSGAAWATGAAPFRFATRAAKLGQVGVNGLQFGFEFRAARHQRITTTQKRPFVASWVWQNWQGSLARRFAQSKTAELHHSTAGQQSH